MSNILIIGAGAAGLIAAGTASRDGNNVTVIERNARPARKVMITGKGRCNLTNYSDDINYLIKNIPTNGRFLYSALSNFMPRDIMNIVENEGVPLKVERGNRVFPISDKAVDCVDALKSYGLKNAKLINDRVIDLKIENNHIVSVLTEAGNEYFADKFILATGGMSYPLTGSTGDGYKLAEKAGHTLIPIRPSLIPVITNEGWCSRLQGLSLKNVRLSLFEYGKKKPIFDEIGEMLFTHFGVSGPLVLSASCHMKKPLENYYFSLNLKPGLTPEQIDNRLIRDFNENLNKDFINSLDKLLPQKLIPVIVNLSGIKPDIKVNQISKEQRFELGKLIAALNFTPKAFRDVSEAIVTSGGVSTKEIDPKTMRSKIIDNLYFAGEIIDVDAYTGGFNLQIAFSTGFAAGKDN